MLSIDPTASIELKAAALEGGRGAFAVTLDGAATEDLIVGYDVTGDATAESDYLPLSGQVVVRAGYTEATLNVDTKNDGRIEGSETVVLTLTDGAGYQLHSDTAKQQATLVIADNEVGTRSSADSPQSLHGKTVFPLFSMYVALPQLFVACMEFRSGKMEQARGGCYQGCGLCCRRGGKE